MSQSITRRSFARGAAGLAGALAAGSAFAAADTRPNIILLMGDDHGWDEVGYYDHPHLKTPVLDEMAAAGLRLDHFYSAAPVCSPTRVSVITGRHPNRCGTFSANWSTRPEEIGIANILSKAGYACGHFGKWHLGPVKKESPINPGAFGFEEWVSHDNFFEMDAFFSRNGGPPKQFQGESSEVVIDETIRFIGRARESGRPFFTVVWFGSPHEPYIGLEKDLALYDDLPESWQSKTTSLTGLDTGLQVKRPLRDVLRERYAEITAMDRSIGNLRGYLDRAGLKGNTLVWYCGDNGTPGDGIETSPFRGQKGRVYEGGVRVPGIIEWPDRIKRPRSTDVPAVTSDMLPTICDLVGQPVPKRPLDGISLKPLIDGGMKERPTPICFWSYNGGREERAKLEPYLDEALQEGTTPLAKQMDGKYTRSFVNYRHPKISEEDYSGARAIVDNQYKLVVSGEGAGDGAERELFDLRNDRGEKENILAKHEKKAEELGKQLRKWQESVLKSLTGADYR